MLHISKGSPWVFWPNHICDTFPINPANKHLRGDKNFTLTEVNRFDILNDKYFNHREFVLELNFSKESILSSNINSNHTFL